MKATKNLAVGAAIAGLILPACALAQESLLPQAKTEGSVTYISGGIGSDESLAMKKEAKNFPLSMVFAEGKRGAYVANVHVTVRDHGGKVLLDAPSSGPLMLLKLPAGDFKVSAELRGKTLQQSVKVAESGSSAVSFTWPATDQW